MVAAHHSVCISAGRSATTAQPRCHTHASSTSPMELQRNPYAGLSQQRAPAAPAALARVPYDGSTAFRDDACMSWSRACVKTAWRQMCAGVSYWSLGVSCSTARVWDPGRYIQRPPPLFLRRGADTEAGSSKSKWQRKQRAQDNGAGQARNRGHAETYQRSGVVVATSPWYLLRPARERGRSSASTAGTRVERGAETHWPRPTPVTDACSPDARCAFEWMLRHAPHRPSAVHFGHLAVRKHARHERSRLQALHAPR